MNPVHANPFNYFTSFKKVILRNTGNLLRTQKKLSIHKSLRFSTLLWLSLSTGRCEESIFTSPMMMTSSHYSPYGPRNCTTHTPNCSKAKGEISEAKPSEFYTTPSLSKVIAALLQPRQYRIIVMIWNSMSGDIEKNKKQKTKNKKDWLWESSCLYVMFPLIRSLEPGIRGRKPGN